MDILSPVPGTSLKPPDVNTNILFPEWERLAGVSSILTVRMLSLSVASILLLLAINQFKAFIAGYF
jgi:hypothetical protein